MYTLCYGRPHEPELTKLREGMRALMHTLVFQRTQFFNENDVQCKGHDIATGRQQLAAGAMVVAGTPQVKAQRVDVVYMHGPVEGWEPAERALAFWTSRGITPVRISSMEDVEAILGALVPAMPTFGAPPSPLRKVIADATPPAAGASDLLTLDDAALRALAESEGVKVPGNAKRETIIARIQTHREGLG